MQCMGTKVNGERCIRQEANTVIPEAPHLHYCNIHRNVYLRHVRGLAQQGLPGHHQPGRCLNVHGTGGWCPNMAHPDQLECGTHIIHRRNVEAARARRNAANAILAERNRRIAAAVDRYSEQGTPWHEVIVDVFARAEFEDDHQQMRWMIAIGYFRFHHIGLIPGQNFTDYWNWVAGGQVGPAPDPNRPARVVIPAPPAVPRGEGLAALARDPQNVHTRHVSEQTNAGLAKLLEKERIMNKPARAPDWIAAKWLVKTYGSWTQVSRIVNDMQHWYAMDTCRERGDRLYRRQLDGLYYTIKEIKDEETRNEAYKRLFEECFEAVGMCCDGHITRLCNVLVGFDDAFAPPVPFGEILQNKMAAIHAMEADTAEKIRLATEFFNEFAVPAEDRAAWLDAF